VGLSNNSRSATFTAAMAPASGTQLRQTKLVGTDPLSRGTQHLADTGNGMDRFFISPNQESFAG